MHSPGEDFLLSFQNLSKSGQNFKISNPDFRHFSVSEKRTLQKTDTKLDCFISIRIILPKMV